MSSFEERWKNGWLDRDEFNDALEAYAKGELALADYNDQQDALSRAFYESLLEDPFVRKIKEIRKQNDEKKD